MYKFNIVSINNELAVCCDCDELLSPYAALHMYGFKVEFDGYYFSFSKGNYKFRASKNGRLVDIEATHKHDIIDSLWSKLFVKVFVDDVHVIVSVCDGKFTVFV